MDHGNLGITRLAEMCIEAATASHESVEKWRRQRRTLAGLPSQLADALLRRLIRQRLLYPSLLEVFQQSVEEIDLTGETNVDAEWLAYLGAFFYLNSLILAECRSINNSALWPLSGMGNLKVLDLSRCSRVTDAGIKHILSIQTLEELNVSETGVTSNGVMLFASLGNLHLLDAGGITVTDEALHSLQVLTKLEYLDLWGSKISNKGISVIKIFPSLSFLNLAWTEVTRLPSLPSITCLNMSNCTIHSIFDKRSTLLAPLEKLILLGANIIDVDEVFSNMEVSSIHLLDMSGSSISDLQILIKMKVLEHLELSFTGISDNLFECIASIGMSLRYLNLSHTKVTSEGLSLLAGNVENVETISLSHTGIDDAALSYLTMMPSLRVIDLSNTNIKGFVYSETDNLSKSFTLSLLSSLIYLESLNLEGTLVRDEALQTLAFLKQISSLYLQSDFLSDISLYALSSLSNLEFLGFRGAVLTTSGLLLYLPPKKLRILDLRGCWLLTTDAISLFSKQHPQIEVRHKDIQINQRDQNNRSSSLSSRITPQARSKAVRALKPKGTPNMAFVDERIKYSRTEMLELQLSTLSSGNLSDPNILPSELRKDLSCKNVS